MKKAPRILLLVLITCATGLVIRGEFYPRLSKPRIEFLDKIDLGELEQGVQKETTFEITNNSTKPLKLSGFKTGCGCFSFGIKTPEGLYTPEELSIPPNQTQTFFVAYLAIQQLGKEEFNQFITFNTDDDSQPLVSMAVVARVHAGLYATPSQLLLGKLSAGQKHGGKFMIRDARPALSRQPFKIVSDISFLQIDKVTRTTTSKSGTSQNETSESFIVEYSVTAPNRTEDLLGEISVKTSKDADIFRIPVSGISNSPIAVSPSNLLLPRTNLDGSLRFSDRCICTAEGKLDSVRIIKCPTGITAKLMPEADSNSVTLIVECSKESVPFSGTRHIKLSLHPNPHDSFEIDIPITIAYIP
jgi:hypothetical protein